jgi:hypothetical protein
LKFESYPAAFSSLWVCKRRVAVEKLHGGHEAILELLLGCDADVAEDRAGEFGKETLD